MRLYRAVRDMRTFRDPALNGALKRKQSSMTTILQITSAARSQGAQSTLLANELTDKLLKSNPGARHVVRNLQAEPLPHLNDSILGAFFTPADQRTPDQVAISARSEALIAELKAADIIVIGAPMYNFGISSQLKTYFDFISRAGLSFQYTATGSEGFVTGKKIFVVTARGGQYVGTPDDTHTLYLKTFLDFLGMTDVTFIYAEGLAMGSDIAGASLAGARDAIAAL